MAVWSIATGVAGDLNTEVQTMTYHFSRKLSASMEEAADRVRVGAGELDELDAREAEGVLRRDGGVLVVVPGGDHPRAPQLFQ